MTRGARIAERASLLGFDTPQLVGSTRLSTGIRTVQPEQAGMKLVIGGEFLISTRSIIRDFLLLTRAAVTTTAPPKR